MTKLERIIHTINKSADRQRHAKETLAERAVRMRMEEDYSPLNMYVRARKEDKIRQRKLGLDYTDFVNMHNDNLVGKCSTMQGDEVEKTVVYTDLGPIIQTKSLDGASVCYEGYCASEDFETATQHFYYAQIGIALLDNTVKYSGYIRDDNGVFHDIKSRRGKSLTLRPYQTIEDRFNAAMLEANPISQTSFNDVFDLSE